MRIEPMLREFIELGFVDMGSRQGLRATVSSRAKGLAYGDGSSSEHLVRFIAFADYVSALSVEPTFTRPSFR